MTNGILRTIFAIIAGIFVLPAMAQNIVLTCKSAMPSGYFETFPEANTKMCAKFGGRSCADKDEDVKKMERCRSTGWNYSHKREYIFEKSSLTGKSEGFAEVTYETCWGSSLKERVKLVATATVISFVDNTNSFNVDRQSLIGGLTLNSNGNWDCEFKEVKTKNKL